MKEVSIGHWTNTSFIVPFYERNIVVHWGSTLVCQDLVVQSDNQYSQLTMIGWKNITVNEGYCNGITSDINISYNPCLQSIVVKKKSFMNVNSLTISNNPHLQTMQTYGTKWGDSAFENLESYVIISSIFFFHFSHY